MDKYNEIIDILEKRYQYYTHKSNNTKNIKDCEFFRVMGKGINESIYIIVNTYTKENRR